MPTFAEIGPDLTCVFSNIFLFTLFQCIFFTTIASKQYDNLVKDKLEILSAFLKDDRTMKPYFCQGLQTTVNSGKWRFLGKELPNGYTLYEGSNKENIQLVLSKHVQEMASYAMQQIHEASLALQSSVGSSTQPSSTAEQSVMLVEVNVPSDDVSLNQAISVTVNDSVVYYGRVPNKFDLMREEDKQNEKDNIVTLCIWAGPFVFVSVVMAVIAAFFGRKHWKPHHTLAMKLVACCFTTEIVYFYAVFNTFQVVGDWELANKSLFK